MSELERLPFAGMPGFIAPPSEPEVPVVLEPCSDCGRQSAVEAYAELRLCRNCRVSRERARDGVPVLPHGRRRDTFEEPRFRGRRYAARRPSLTCIGCSVPLLPHEHPNVYRPTDHLDSARAPRNPPVCTDCARDATASLGLRARIDFSAAGKPVQATRGGD